MCALYHAKSLLIDRFRRRPERMTGRERFPQPAFDVGRRPAHDATSANRGVGSAAAAMRARASET